MRMSFFGLVGCFAALMCCIPATAAPIPWSTQPFTLMTRGTKLDSVLRELGANYGIPVVVSNKVTDVYIGSLDNISPQEALDRLARLHKLAWYYNGQALYIYRADEVNRQLLTPTFIKTKDLIAQFGETNSPYCRASVIATEAPVDFGAIEVWGVPACLERFTQMAKQLDEQAQNQGQNEEIVKAFPLRYANASDTTYTYRGKDVIVPGVVAMLKEMVQGKTKAPIAVDGKPALLSDTNANLPLFTVDTRQNAVIIRDRKVNMHIYADLVKEIDTKQPLIEISVVIIDIDAGDLTALGIDWTAAAQIGGGTVSFNNSSLNTGSFSTVIANTGNFLAQINALEEHSKAKVLSRPSVVTLNNMQAVLDRNITFYTTITSTSTTGTTAQLQSVTTGSLLRVTPRILEDGDRRRVMLTLNIQDGNQTTAINGLPQIQDSQIDTQASLFAGQSLLLGGFVQDKVSTDDRKIPLLGDIPILGRLFHSSNSTTVRVVRLFLIKAEPISQP
ncbi:MAG: EscC/YscC/HrcC family type III secretion system outer membrane ring protein [Ottowia sp.]|nr:EscC/YscC/HrcC family type III secretion system outer membrane ring protein [Ottowia sp.]